MHANSRDWNKAIELFKEAIGHNERDIKVFCILESAFQIQMRTESTIIGQYLRFLGKTATVQSAMPTSAWP